MLQNQKIKEDFEHTEKYACLRMIFRSFYIKELIFKNDIYIYKFCLFKVIKRDIERRYKKEYYEK